MNLSLSSVGPELANSLRSQLQIHHSIYSLPCVGEYLEEVISKSLAAIQYKNDWKPNRSHTVSTDLTIDEGPSVSIKSGTYNPEKGSLIFSGSRLGKHPNVVSMVESVIENAADWYFCIAKDDSDWKLENNAPSEKIYYLFTFESSALPYSECEWNERKTKTGGSVYYADSKGFHAEIRASMSHQLWTTVDQSITGKPFKVSV